VLAVSDSTVVRVGTRRRGGKVVVLRDDERDLMIYYAHLDSWSAEIGEVVAAGDPIGTVGNTGNARGTPPHLHIGLYQGGWRRPVDPWNYFVGPTAVRAPAPRFADRVGSWASISEDLSAALAVDRDPPLARYRNRNPLLVGAGDSFPQARMERDPEIVPPPAPARVEFRQRDAVRIVGAVGDMVRVRRTGGTAAMIPVSALADARRPLDVRSPSVLRDPAVGDAVRAIAAGSTVELVGRISAGPVVRAGDGRVGVLVPSGYSGARNPDE
jgi:hypothetical protein